MPGPPPKPTALKILEGNRGHQKLNLNEPKPTPGIGAVPSWMSAEGKRAWKVIVPELERLGLLTVIDGLALSAACSAYGEAVECRRYLKKNGRTMKVGEAGYEQQRPEVSIEQKAWDRFHKFCTEFGLTAAARSRLRIVDELKDKPGSTLNGNWKAS